MSQDDGAHAFMQRIAAATLFIPSEQPIVQQSMEAVTNQQQPEGPPEKQSRLNDQVILKVLINVIIIHLTGLC